ncbi:hypothetical protein [Erythrobacter donghaensis]|uniref:hypothetical protein n=1 Tax=Erythrobacter donghaensis TaxID=267135 RepID=UPI00117E7255|nr:hypothetical protein [Erythrobacter donghaensis]
MIVARGPIIIRQRWWGHLAVLLCLPIFGILAAAMASSGFALFAKPGGWWRGLIILGGAGLMLLIVVLQLNHLFAFRLEIYPHGLRLAGNFWSHRITWQEITRIEKRHNYRAPGYHVAIEVDGSRLPRRHWSNLWWARYQIPSGMEKGAGELTDYLKRKRREALKRQQSVAE